LLRRVSFGFSVDVVVGAVVAVVGGAASGVDVHAAASSTSPIVTAINLARIGFSSLSCGRHPPDARHRRCPEPRCLRRHGWPAV
jgi:hypothetical protein